MNNNYSPYVTFTSLDNVFFRWLTSDESNVVSLHCAAFGYEHIFMSIAEKFKSKIHIAKWKIQAYADLPAVANILTADGNSTRIHVCNFRVSLGGVCW